eukprot:5503368-Alexandrium_andersonii.AAC.1
MRGVRPSSASTCSSCAQQMLEATQMLPLSHSCWIKRRAASASGRRGAPAGASAAASTCRSCA